MVPHEAEVRWERGAGEPGRGDGGRPALTRVTLRPDVRFSGRTAPDDAAVALLHRRAHEECIIARSLRATVEVCGSWHHAVDPTAEGA